MVTVVNETLAKRFWPAGDAIGRQIKQGRPEDKNAMTRDRRHRARREDASSVDPMKAMRAD